MLERGEFQADTRSIGRLRVLYSGLTSLLLLTTCAFSQSSPDSERVQVITKDVELRFRSASYALEPSIASIPVVPLDKVNVQLVSQTAPSFTLQVWHGDFEWVRERKVDKDTIRTTYVQGVDAPVEAFLSNQIKMTAALTSGNAVQRTLPVNDNVEHSFGEVAAGNLVIGGSVAQNQTAPAFAKPVPDAKLKVTPDKPTWEHPDGTHWYTVRVTIIRRAKK